MLVASAAPVSNFTVVVAKRVDGSRLGQDAKLVVHGGQPHPLPPRLQFGMQVLG